MANYKIDKTQELCEKLYLAAKKSKTRRFHALYDKIHRMDFLESAWEQVKRNKGSAGIDGVSITDIIDYGEKTYLQELHDLLLDTHKYHPQKVKQVTIPKPDGRQRILGIPTVKDRIVQTATKRILEPIFEADFLECSYGFRPNRSPHDALEEIRIWTNEGYKYVLKADISGCFDEINHQRLLEFVSQRINDRKILKLIRKWLERGCINQTELKGTPQGSPISPLLANIYLHEFDKLWMKQKVVEGKLIRYADDFVILFKTEQDAKVGLRLAKIKMEGLNLTLKAEKTTIANMNGGKEGFDFLGFHLRQAMSCKYKKRYTNKWPGNKAMTEIRGKIRDVLSPRSKLPLSLKELVEQLNPILRGWRSYFRFGNSHKKFAAIDSYVHELLALWWSKKHRKVGRRWSTAFDYKTYVKSGVVRMSGNIQHWSKHSNAQG